jgi:hypothetical protein
MVERILRFWRHSKFTLSAKSFRKWGSLRLRTSATYRKRFAEWGAALNAEAKRRGEDIAQDSDFPDYLPNIFYESFPISEEGLREYWVEHFARGRTPALALDAQGYVEWWTVADDSHDIEDFFEAMANPASR